MAKNKIGIKPAPNSEIIPSVKIAPILSGFSQYMTAAKTAENKILKMNSFTFPKYFVNAGAKTVEIIDTTNNDSKYNPANPFLPPHSVSAPKNPFSSCT